MAACKGQRENEAGKEGKTILEHGLEYRGGRERSAAILRRAEYIFGMSKGIF